jgi:ATPase family AAA domain-containing protein 3A/B
MFYGPPGTGKTLFAKKLATSSGMDFAILTGGDIAPLGRDAVTEIHKLFDWANTSRKGLVVFVDEADAFLRKRSNETMSEDQRNALNAFLYRTGTETNNFMIVYATNEPEDLDRAIYDRTDDLIEFGFPEKEERKRMLEFYFDKYVANAHNLGGSTFRKPEQIKIDGIDSDMVKDLADKTEGFSGREISKLAIGWQAAAHGSGNSTLTKDLFETVFERMLDAKLFKKQMEGSN